jgi:hypothetical protein
MPAPGSNATRVPSGASWRLCSTLVREPLRSTRSKIDDLGYSIGFVVVEYALVGNRAAVGRPGDRLDARVDHLPGLATGRAHDVEATARTRCRWRCGC